MKGSNSKGNLENNASLQSELEALLLQQQQNRELILQRERELDISRSGSAPPTVEGALALSAARNLFRHPDFAIYDGSGSSSSNNSASIGVLTEEEIRSHPSYLEYYYSHENINPRLPPPLLSREDWRVAQRLMAAGFDLGGNLADNRGSLPLLPLPPGLSVRKPEDDVMELRKAALMNLSRKNSTESLEMLALMNMSRRNSVESLDKAALMNLSQKNSVESLEKAAALINMSRNNSLESLEKAAALMNMSRKNSVDSLEKAAALMNMSRKNSVESLEKAALMNRKISVESLEKAALMNRKNSVDSLEKTTLANLSQKNSAESLENGSSSSGMGVRRKSFADILQEGLSHPKSNLCRASSHNSVSDVLDSTRTPNSKAEEIRNKAESLEAMLPEKTLAVLSNPTSLRSSMGSSFPTNVNSAALNAPNFHSPGIFEIADVAASLSGLSMSNSQLHPENMTNYLLQIGIPISHHQSLLQHYGDISRARDLADHLNNLNLMRANGSSSLNVPVNFPRRTSSTTNLQLPHSQPDFATLEDLKMLYQNSNISGLRSGNQTGLHFPPLDPHHLQYLQKMSNHGTNLAQLSGNTSKGIFYHGLEEFQALEKAYLEALLMQQAQQYQSHYLQKNGIINNQYPSFSPYQENLVLSPTSGISPRSSVIQNEKSAQTASTLRNLNGEATGMSQTGSNTKGRAESLLEVLKNNKTKTLELSDILGHVVEFSMDQFGSRFIQQKLETATVEEKTKILAEIIPHAHDLMVDVFGNYVVQKFFEHGTEIQQKELAMHTIGHVLPLTLQMYGCRVVQKALEVVVDVELQTKMVKELDGSVMKCVHDQNGNHVIQKCIECVPQDSIQFIISAFLGQVVTLSSHPYGCRVIQRVLEHCTDLKTQQIIMDEILKSVCKLAQDQYGNYVIQHVVQHGKPHEQSMIISKLGGQIVKMSQQKFASNVVEKCLIYCTPEERQILINEMLGSTDENEPLQAMMKDPFGNYVVQKVLETCDDKNRELILSRIKVHLTSLKKYTYGKHIVSRVEKLITTGEKHGGQSSSNSTQPKDSSVHTRTG